MFNKECQLTHTHTHTRKKESRKGIFHLKRPKLECTQVWIWIQSFLPQRGGTLEGQREASEPRWMDWPLRGGALSFQPQRWEEASPRRPGPLRCSWTLACCVLTSRSAVPHSPSQKSDRGLGEADVCVVAPPSAQPQCFPGLLKSPLTSSGPHSASPSHKRTDSVLPSARCTWGSKPPGCWPSAALGLRSGRPAGAEGRASLSHTLLKAAGLPSACSSVVIAHPQVPLRSCLSPKKQKTVESPAAWLPPGAACLILSQSRRERESARPPPPGRSALHPLPGHPLPLA